MKLDDIKQGFHALRESVTEGWNRLRESASSSLTHFNPGEKSELPASSEVDDSFYFPSSSWGLLSGDVYEGDNKIIVRLEIPGLKKENFRIDVLDDQLSVSGEKQFEREEGDGRYRLFQCAYGSFERRIQLPTTVIADQASANYQNGILRIELPKAEHAAPKRIQIKID